MTVLSRLEAIKAGREARQRNSFRLYALRMSTALSYRQRKVKGARIRW
jgi:hypothetical protein